MPISRDGLPIFLGGFAHVYDLRRFSNRFSDTVITSAVLKDNDAKRIFDQKVRVTFQVRRAHFTG